MHIIIDTPWNSHLGFFLHFQKLRPLGNVKVLASLFIVDSGKKEPPMVNEHEENALSVQTGVGS